MKRFEVYKSIGGVGFNKPHIKMIKVNRKGGVSVWFVGRKRGSSGTWRHLRIQVTDIVEAEKLFDKLTGMGVGGDLYSDFMQDLKSYMIENKIAEK